MMLYKAPESRWVTLNRHLLHRFAIIHKQGGMLCVCCFLRYKYNDITDPRDFWSSSHCFCPQWQSLGKDSGQSGWEINSHHRWHSCRLCMHIRCGPSYSPWLQIWHCLRPPRFLHLPSQWMSGPAASSSLGPLITTTSRLFPLFFFFFTWRNLPV